MAKYMYTGSDERVYPEFLHFGGSLVVDAGVVLDFGDQEPPNDGLWAEAPAKAKVTPPPAPVQAAPEQPLSSTSSDAEAAADTAKEAS